MRGLFRVGPRGFRVNYFPMQGADEIGLSGWFCNYYRQAFLILDGLPGASDALYAGFFQQQFLQFVTIPQFRVPHLHIHAFTWKG